MMSLEKIISLASEFEWQLIDHQEPVKMVSFKRDGQRVNVYYSTMTVATCLNHPKLGKTQMFRRNIGEKALRKIFKNPRVHLNCGYRWRTHA